MWAQATTIIIGFFLMLAPGIWSFDKIAGNNLYVIGPLIITFAITALWEVNRNLRWFNVAAGAWLICSPLVLGIEGFAAALAAFAGNVIVILSLIKGKISQKFGGGWRSLLQDEPPHVKATLPNPSIKKNNPNA